MNKQELIKHFEEMEYVSVSQMGKKAFIDMIEQLDEPQSIKLKDVIARIEKFDLATKAVWINEILYKLGSDYGLHKYYAGYEQGKFDGAMEREKVTVPQFVADWIEKCKSEKKRLHESLTYTPFGVNGWVSNPKNQETFARAWLDGYEIEREKRYTVKIKAILGQYLERYYLNNEELTPQFKRMQPTGGDELPTFTRKELEKAGFAEVFNSPLFEVEEVE